MKKQKSPNNFKMPVSGALAGAAKNNEIGRYFQLYTVGSMEPKTARAIAAWLIKVADWMEVKLLPDSSKPKVKNPPARTFSRRGRVNNPRKKKSSRQLSERDIDAL